MTNPTMTRPTDQELIDGLRSFRERVDVRHALADRLEAAVAASGSPPSPNDAESVAAIARACDMPNETRLTRLAANVVAMRANYARICDALQSCVQRHKLGLGGELIDELVVAEVDRSRASSGSTGAPPDTFRNTFRNPVAQALWGDKEKGK